MKTSPEEEIRKSLDFLFDPDQVMELRAIGVSDQRYRRPHIVAGYFDADHRDDLVSAALDLTEKAKGVYVIMNELNSALLGRSANRIQPDIQTTSDADILRRKWILVDVDAGQPSGVSSSDSEHEAALRVTRAIYDTLRAEGVPDMGVADSGNGGHLLIPVDLPAQDDGLVKCVLETFANRFNESPVNVDTSVFNPARITKLIGTKAKKGDDRPHRLSHWLHLPDKVLPAGLDIVRTWTGAEVQPTRASQGSYGNFDLGSWISAHGVPVRSGPTPWSGGGPGARKWVLEECIRGHRDKAGFIAQRSSGQITAGCLHESCRDWKWRDLRAHYEPESATRNGHGDHGVHIKANGKSSEGSESDSEGSRKNQATQIVELCLASGIDLWHDPEFTAYATLKIGNHNENWPIKSSRFRQWTKRQFYTATDKVPNAQAMQDALGVLESKAQFDGDEYQTFIRLAEHNGGDYYLDLSNDDWKAVEITSNGWTVVSDPPVKFRRPKGMLELPIPVNGDVNLLRQFVNLREGDENAWHLLVAYLVQALRPRGPYPVLAVHGEQGSAKTTLVRMLRSLVDPNLADCRAQPRDERDLMIAARNGWVVALDNLSSISAWLSDALCRLSTGGALATRTLYTDDDEILFKAQCPVILNGITELATRGDLLDRAILITLAAIPEDQRRSEKELWADFEAVRPQILGGLLDAVSGALATVDSVQLDKLPRMADFANWLTAAETALGWPEGSFMDAYTDNRKAANETALDASPVTGAIIAVLKDSPEIEQGATDLLTMLNSKVSEKTLELKAWPKSGSQLSRVLKRLAPNLRGIGVEVEFNRAPGGGRRRTIEIRQGVQNAVPSCPIVPNTESQAQIEEFLRDGTRDDVGDSDASIVPINDSAVPTSTPNGTTRDDRDDEIPTSSTDAWEAEL